MGTASFPLMFGGFGSSAPLDSPAWHRAGMPAKQVKAVIISLWNKPIFRRCFITAAECFLCPVERLAPAVRGSEGVKPWLSTFWSPALSLLPAVLKYARTTALQPSQRPCCGCRSGKNTHTRNKLKFSAARGWLCGAGKFAVYPLVTLFLSQALHRSTGLDGWGVACSRVHPQHLGGEFSRGLQVFSALLQGRGGGCGSSTQPPVMPTAAARGAAMSPNLAAGSAKLEPSGAFPRAAGITDFCCAVVSSYRAHSKCVCVYIHTYTHIYMHTCRYICLLLGA